MAGGGEDDSVKSTTFGFQVGPAPDEQRLTSRSGSERVSQRGAEPHGDVLL